MRLVLCPTCQRHVRADDGRCPFCGERAPGQRPSIAGVAAAPIVGLGLAAGCSGSTDGGGGQGGGGDGGTAGAMPAYGPPPADAQADVDQNVEAGDEGMIAAYGPPPDAGVGGAYGPPAN